MKNKVILPIVIFCVVMAFMVGTLVAQEEQTSANRRIGSSAATELLIPVGARGMAMGGSNMAVSIGVESIHWNPGGLARGDYNAEGMVSSMAYIADIRMNYGAVGINFGGFGTIGLSIRNLDFGEITMTSNDDPYGDADRTYRPGFFTVGLTYSRKFTDAISFGATVKVISESMGRATGSAFAADLGVQYHGVAGIRGLNFGVALKNYGPQMQFGGSGLLHKAEPVTGRRPEQFFRSEAASFELPSTLNMGVTYNYQVNENMSFLVNSAFVNNNMALNSYQFGGEVVYEMGTISLFGRGGYETAPNLEDVDEFIFGPSAGFGIYLETAAMNITVDYGWRQTEYFNNNSVFCFKFEF